ncbi:hypothetical protein D9757_006735 [Collybiopsis confluens]|uniref:S-adenosyl-L-methionine-dependent methyltransferase n=1 Tax=Collybiopsis confluens TaxID=2823264 RepID=A0A8H5HLL0_9AGAR|nr:hypothetical protein D9757_006735 [Collybiopsis confluens]
MAPSQAEIDSFHKSAFPNANEMRKYLTQDSGSWDDVWKNNLTLWEAGAVDVQPPLRQCIESGEVAFPKQGRAMVPGCGRGFDTIYLASALGWDYVLGADVSETALAAANDFLKTKGVSPSVAAKVKFQITDFFKMSVPDEEKFDLIYDYTFYVAIPPSMRATWGTKMQELVKPGGHLITLMFPHIQEPYDLGPPYWSSFEDYVHALGGSDGSGGAKGWEIVCDKIPPAETLSDVHKGKDRLVVWKRL